VNVRRWFLVVVVALIGLSPAAEAQQSSIGVPVPALGDGPWVFDTAEQHKINVSVVTKQLEHPWAIAFLPNGDMLVTERPGRLRIVRGNSLDPQPIAGLPTVRTDGNGGLMDVALHPEFTENRLVYLTYTKPMEDGRGAPALARGRLDDKHALTDVRDLIVTEAYEGNSGLNGRVVFGQDGKVYMSTGGRVATVSQDMMSLRGKVLRLNDDGTVPDDNPFVNHDNHRPEIYTFGHRNTLGLILNPLTGDLWQHENGPNGGDEINILSRGRNYGWPIVSFGRDYSGARLYEPTRKGLETPLVVWLPAIAVAGMTVYTGDKFPAWQGNVFVGSLQEGGIPGTGHLERIVFNEKTEEMRRESILTELRQRIREVRQGPDGFLYVLTDEDNGALLRIEPTP
jgi:glucose/arabinose dehydrogenase